MPPAFEPSAILSPDDDISVAAARQACVPHYFMLPTIQALATILHTGGSFFLEMAGRSAMERDFLLLQQGSPDFGLCLTTLHTYNPQVADIITQGLNEHFSMSLSKKMQIMSCLQEALSNAVIHGNLCVNCPRDSMESFDRYYTMINEWVVTPDFKDLRVYVQAWNTPSHLRIRVTHEGGGNLDAETICEGQPAQDQKSGRGLFIIQSLADHVATDDGCKSIDISFTY